MNAVVAVFDLVSMNQAKPAMLSVVVDPLSLSGACYVSAEVGVLYVCLSKFYRAKKICMVWYYLR